MNDQGNVAHTHIIHEVDVCSKLWNDVPEMKEKRVM